VVELKAMEKKEMAALKAKDVDIARLNKEVQDLTAKIHDTHAKQTAHQQAMELAEQKQMSSMYLHDAKLASSGNNKLALRYADQQDKLAKFSLYKSSSEYVLFACLFLSHLISYLLIFCLPTL
jgi:hypothetical protein